MKVIVASNLSKHTLPINAILYWGGTSTELPSGWSIFTEAADAFIMGTDPSGILLTKQGSAEHYHSENGTSTDNVHKHADYGSDFPESSGSYQVTQGTDIEAVGKHTHWKGKIEFENSSGHSHTINNTSTNGHLPLYRRYYLMKYEGAENIPVKAIALWSGELDTIPEGWRICDGSTQDGFTVPNLKQRMIYIPTTDSQVEDDGGNTIHNHTRASNTNSGGAHYHRLTFWSTYPINKIGVKSGSNALIAKAAHYHSGNKNSKSSGDHNHTLPATNNANHMPPYINLYYIMKVTA